MRAFIAVVCLIAAVSARSLQKRSDGEDGHWVDTWLASEDDVLQSTAEEVKAIKGKLLRDVDGLDNALKNLMSGDAIAAIGSCPEQFMRIGECMRGACKAVKEALTSDKDLVQQVSFTKGVVSLIAKGARGVGELAKACGYAEKKKRDFEDWAAAGLISEDELKNVDKAEVERVAGNLRKDMDSIEADLDSLLSEGIDGPAAEAVEKHLEASVELAELHEEEGTDAIKPARVEVPRGCRKEDFGTDCEENFKRVVGCLKAAVKGMKETFDSDAPVVGKIAKVKGIVKLVSEAAGPIKELHAACTSKRSLAKFFN